MSNQSYPETNQSAQVPVAAPFVAITAELPILPEFRRWHPPVKADFRVPPPSKRRQPEVTADLPVPPE